MRYERVEFCSFLPDRPYPEEMTMKAWSTLTTLLVAGSVTLAGCTTAADLEKIGQSEATALPSFDTSSISVQEDIAALLPQSITADGKLTVGTSADYAPAEFTDANGAYVGYEVDLSRALAAVLGLELVTENAEFDSILPSIGSRYDIGISAFTVTAEREANANMISFITVGSQFNVAQGNPANVDVSDPMNLCGLTIGFQTGTAQEDQIASYSEQCVSSGKDAVTMRSYSLNSDAITALIGGTLDAVYSDSTVAGYAQLNTGGAVETIGETVDSAPQGIVVARDDAETTEAMRAAMQYLMDLGIWTQILESWGIDASAAQSTAVVNPQV